MSSIYDFAERMSASLTWSSGAILFIERSSRTREGASRQIIPFGEIKKSYQILTPSTLEIAAGNVWSQMTGKHLERRPTSIYFAKLADLLDKPEGFIEFMRGVLPWKALLTSEPKDEEFWLDPRFQEVINLAFKETGTSLRIEEIFELAEPFLSETASVSRYLEAPIDGYYVQTVAKVGRTAFLEGGLSASINKRSMDRLEEIRLSKANKADPKAP